MKLARHTYILAFVSVQLHRPCVAPMVEKINVWLEDVSVIIMQNLALNYTILSEQTDR